MPAKPRKIIYLLDALAHGRAGTEGQILQLLALLDRSRYEPAVALLRSSEYLRHTGLPCPVTVLGITKLASLPALAKIVRFAFKLRRQGYRLAHCYFNDVSIIAPGALKLFGIRVIVSRRDMGFWYTPANLFCLRRIEPFVDRYVANSIAVKRNVESLERVPPRKISVIYNGYEAPGDDADATVPAPLAGLSDRSPVVGIVANLRPIKRLDTLLEAFSIVGKRFGDARLVVVGDEAPSAGPSLRAQLDRLALDLGIADRVIFAGSSDTPRSYVRRFDVAVLCSESEGFSNAVIEYMQCARPVVCTDTGGNAEIVEDGRNGFLVPVGDSSALADRIVRLLSDTALAERLGSAAQRSVHAYSGDRMVAEQMACYDEVLDRVPMRDAPVNDAEAARPQRRARSSGARTRSRGT